MKTKIAIRLKRAREKRGLSQASLAELSGVPQQTIARIEGGDAKSTKSTFKLAKALDVPAAWLAGEIGTDSVPTHNNNDRLHYEKNKTTLSGITVRGQVRAGTWTEALEWDESQQFMFPAPFIDGYPIEKRFGLVVSGDSMDKVYPEGTLLDCIPLEYSPRKLKTGDHVIVEREHKVKGYEATVKEIEFMSDGRTILHPRSHDPNHGPFLIGDANNPNLVDNMIIRVTSLVVGSYTRRL